MLTPVLLLCAVQYLLMGGKFLDISALGSDFSWLSHILTRDVVAVASECALISLVLVFCSVHLYATTFEAGVTMEKRREHDAWKRKYPSLSTLAKGLKIFFNMAATMCTGYVCFVGVRSTLNARVFGRYSV